MKGWEVRKLGEVCDLIARGVAPKYLEQGGTCVLNQKCIRDHSINFQFARRHDQNTKRVPQDRIIQVGDVLVNSTGAGTLGRVAQVRSEPPEPLTVDTHVTIVRPNAGKFFPDFFGYMLIKIEDEIADSGEGASGQTELSRSTLAEKFDVSFPVSLDEQRRIVTVLDEAFAGLEAMRAKTQANLANARALFDSHLNAIFSQKGEGWVETTLGRLCEIRHGFAFKSEFFTDNGDHVLLTPGNFYESGGYRDRGNKQKFYVGEIPDGYILAKGDLLVAMTEQAAGLLGSPILVPESGKFLHNQRLGLVVGKPGAGWINEFFFHAFNTRAVRREIHDSASGVKVRHTSPSKIGEIIVSFPKSKAEKLDIVQQLADLEGETIRLESLYRQKLTAIDELKQSILQKAFAGELTRDAAPAVVSPANDNRRTTAMVLALAYDRHKRAHRDLSFGHVKGQKILHMVEAEAGFDLGRSPTRDAAGPNDFPHMLAADNWAEATKHYSFTQTEKGYSFKPLANFAALIKEAQALPSDIRARIDRIINLFIPMDMQESEIFATVYAAWNNLLIEGMPVTDDAILRAAREEWHPNKLKIDMAEFHKALRLIRQKNCAPSGKGKFVSPSPQGNLFA